MLRFFDIMEYEIIRLKQLVGKLTRQHYVDQLEIKRWREEGQGQSSDRSATKKYPDITKKAVDIDIQFDLVETEKPQEAMKPAQILKGAVYSTSRVPKLVELYLGKFRNFNSDESRTRKFIPVPAWEYVIVCPNPDEYVERSINFDKAGRIFKKCFKPEEAATQHQTRLNFQTEMKAFKGSFDRLPDYKLEGKRFSRGGRLVKMEHNFYEDRMIEAHDFMTLIRNIILIKLSCNLRIHTKQLLSANGKYIYILLYIEESELEKEAERIEYNLQLELGMTDLASLEPCDELLRPFSVLEKPDLMLDKLADEVSEFNKDVFGLGEKNQEGFGEMYHPTGVTPEIWNSYRIYLEYIKKGLDSMKEKEVPENYKYLYYHKLIKSALRKANLNKNKEDRLQTLWDRIGLKKPLGAYSNFLRKLDPETGENLTYNLWRTYRKNETGSRSIFRNSDRLKLIYSIIHKQIAIHELIRRGLVVCHFPLHNFWELTGEPRFRSELSNEQSNQIDQILADLKEEAPKEGLADHWKVTGIYFRLPLGRIRAYFGEKIGLYWAFIALYGYSLITPGIVGFIVFIIQRLYSTHDKEASVANAFYCIFIAAWGTVYLEIWRRRESSLAIKWGMMDFEEDEIARPQFKGLNRRSPVTDELDEVYYSPQSRKSYMVLGFVVSTILMCMVIAIVAGIIILRWELTNRMIVRGIDLSGYTCSTINAIQIQLFNFCYNIIAVKLTELENHRTQSEFENSLIMKTYVFQFVNSFNSLFYIAFLKTHLEGCIVDDDGQKVREIGASCMDELYIQLISIFTVSFLKNFIELGKPYLMYKFGKKLAGGYDKNVRKVQSLISKTDYEMLRDDIDRQVLLPPYVTREADGTLGEYLEIAVLFGYITLFAVAFPLSALLALVLIAIEIQVDKLKLLRLVRRPHPMGAKNIGTWWVIFQTTSIISLFTNSAVLCFTSPTFEDFEVAEDNIYITFAIFSGSLLAFRAWLKKVIPDISSKYETAFKRHQSVVDKWVIGWVTNKRIKFEESTYINPRIYCTVRPLSEKTPR
jgi:hypothetical protein